MDYEAMWNELKAALDSDSCNQGLPIYDRLAFAKVLMRMDSIRAENTGIYIKNIPTASDMGKLGGSAKTEAKSSASRENGKKGGRPKKIKPE